MYTCVHANMEGRGVHPGSYIILYLGFQLWIPFFSYLSVCLCVCCVYSPTPWRKTCGSHLSPATNHWAWLQSSPVLGFHCCDKRQDQKQLGGERACFSLELCIPSRREVRAGTGKDELSRSHRRMLTCSFCFLRHPRTTCSGTALPTVF